MLSAGRVAVAGGGELDCAFTACMVNRRTPGNSSASVLSLRRIDLPPFVRSMQRFVVPKRSLTFYSCFPRAGADAGHASACQRLRLFSDPCSVRSKSQLAHTYVSAPVTSPVPKPYL